MPTTRIFLCRHATPSNPDGVFYGHLDGFGLSEVGVAEAHGLGELLAAEPVRAVYASPLQRARETAEVVAGHLPAPVPVELRDDLLETRFGLYIQGVRRVEALWRRPLLFVHYLRPGTLAVDEKVGDLADRVGRVCLEAVRANPGEAAVLVSHADPVKAFWNRHLGRADWRFHQLRVDRGCCLELRYQGERLESVVHHAPRRRNGAGRTL